jgi:hypothetical protein
MSSDSTRKERRLTDSIVNGSNPVHLFSGSGVPTPLAGKFTFPTRESAPDSPESLSRNLGSQQLPISEGFKMKLRQENSFEIC